MKPNPLRTCGLLLLFCGSTGWAATTTYFDREQFVNATATLPGIHQEITFDPFCYSTPENPHVIGPSVTISNVTFTGSILVVGKHPQYATSGVPLMNFESFTPMGIHFQNGANAFGAYYSSESAYQFTNFTATLTLDTGQQFTFNAPTNPEFTFFGWISDQPINDMTFSDGGNYIVGLDKVHAEAIKDVWMVSQVPEPSTSTLIFLFATGAMYLRRQRTNFQSRPHPARRPSGMG